MHPWAEKQVKPWTGHGVRSRDGLLPALGRETCFLFEVRNNVVHCDYKLTHLVYAQRAQKFHFFFNSIVSRYCIPDISFALDVGDEAADCPECPLFTFQRQKNSVNILFPDNDFVWYDCYSDRTLWGIPDTVTFGEKSASAVFVGSTTGAGHITAPMLASGAVPRVEAARFFRGSKNVDFRLSNIVQCDNEAASILAAEGFGGKQVGWQEQLTHKFLISIDGNGATCSRVYISLLSNSALVKYDSDCEMFYFDGLVAGTHYLPVMRHPDVVEIVETEAETPGSYLDIAEAGKDFATRYLSRGALESYTAELLWAYADAA